MDERYIPKVKKEELQHGAYYVGECRNASLARWNAEQQHFVHWREKFGSTFLETIRCPEDEARFDVFVTERLASAEEVAARLPPGKAEIDLDGGR